MKKTLFFKFLLIVSFLFVHIFSYAQVQDENDTIEIFNDTPYYDYTLDKRQIVYDWMITHKNTNTSFNKLENRNAFSIIYQIGIFNWIGVEYEIRWTDYIGLNLGGGWKGFTTGLKIHTSKKRNSPYCLISYRNYGLGLVDVAAVELGTRILFTQSPDFGIVLQGGVGNPFRVHSTLEKEYFKGKVPSVLFFGGVGITF